MRSFTSYAASLAPAHWWALDETSGAAGPVDAGVLTQSAVYAGGAATALLNSAVQAEPSETKRARAIYGDAGSSAATTAPLRFSTSPGANTPGFSLVFWTVQGDNYSRRNDDLLGLTRNRNGGFYVSIRDGAISFIRLDHDNSRQTLTLAKQWFKEPETLAAATRAQWSMVAFVVDESGRMFGYVDGVLRATYVGPSPGVIVPTSPESRFKIGHLGYGDTAPEQGFDEVMLFERALSIAEIQGLYQRALYGSVFDSVDATGDDIGLASLGGYKISASRLPSLSGATDITSFVQSWEVQRSINEIAPAATLVAYEDQESLTATLRALAPGKYVVIEHRTFDEDTRRFGAWLPVGHFISEGSVVQTEAGTGAAQRTFRLYAPPRVMAYDPHTQPIIPDRMEFEKATLRLLRSTEETLVFGLPRPDSGLPYTQLTPNPTPTLFASKFQNWDTDSDDDTPIPVADRPSRLAIKSAQGSIQVLGGPGEVRIDRTFYEAPLSSGMGNPDPEGGLQISCGRDVTYVDVIDSGSVAEINAGSTAWEVQLDGVSNPGGYAGEYSGVGPDASGSIVYSDSAATGDWGHSSGRVTDGDSPFGYHRKTADADQTVTYTVQGTAIGFYGRKAPDGGLMVVEVDGGLVPTSMKLPTMGELKAQNSTAYSAVTGISDDAYVYDCYGASESEEQFVVVASGLDGGSTHTLVLTATDQAHDSSSSNVAYTSGFGVAVGVPTDPPLSTAARTVFVKSGVAKGRVYHAYPKSVGASGVAPGGGGFAAAAAATTGSLVWGTVAGVTKPSTLAANGAAVATFDGAGAPSAAIDGGDGSAFAGPSSGPADTKMLVFSGLPTTGFTDVDEEVTGLEVRVKRWALIYSRAFTQDSYDGLFVDWDANGLVAEKVVQWELDGQAIGANKADATRTAAPGVYTTPNPQVMYLGAADNLKVFGGPGDVWSIGTLRVRDLATLKLRLQAQVLADSFTPCWAGVREVEVRVWTKQSGNYSQVFTLTDLNGYPVNPLYEGLAVGDAVQIGHANRPEDVLRLIAYRDGMQEANPDLPLHLSVEPNPRQYQAIMQALPLSLDNEAYGLDLIREEVLQSATPNYKILSLPTGRTVAKPTEQKSTPDWVIDGVIDQSQNSGSRNVFTGVVFVSEGGESINLARSSAVRAVKMDGWATSDSTSTGRGIESRSGLAYARTDEGYAAAHARLLQLIDGSSRTPVLDGGGWDDYNSIGVLWAASGSKVEPYTWEDTTLFMLDLGNWGSDDPHIEAIHGTHIQTYPDKAGVPMVLTVWSMDSLGALRATGAYPPPTANQAWADKAVSYFPDDSSVQWRLLVDKVPLDSGNFQIEADLFEQTAPVRTRFLKVVMHQGHYHDGDGDRNRRRIRAGMSEIRVYGSRRIVASATLGTADGLNTGSHKKLRGMLGLRRGFIEPNYLVSSYQNGQDFARSQLDELYREFAPSVFQIAETGVIPGETAQVFDVTYAARRTVYVEDVQLTSEGTVVMTGTDYQEVPRYVE